MQLLGKLSSLNKRASRDNRASRESEAALQATGENVTRQTIQAVPVPPPPPQLSIPSSLPEEVQPANYALADDDYIEWKRALTACQKEPDSIAPIKALACKPKLLNWRSPVSGQTLLHELVAQGASETVLEEAVQLGCQRALANSKGETIDMVFAKKRRACDPRSEFASSSQRANRSVFNAPAARVQMSSMPNSTFSSSRRASRASGRWEPASLAPSSLPQALDEPVPALAAPSFGSSVVKRKCGQKLLRNEVASVPKAKIDLDLDLMQESTLNRDDLECAIKKAYGGKARVQIDDVADSNATNDRTGSRMQRMQNVKCRVMFDDASEARKWQKESRSGGSAQQSLSEAMQLDGGAIDFASETKMDEVDAITLKLDSDSAHILCGACLLYAADNTCEKVVCHSDRQYSCCVQHSGDTKVDGKSVHTISVVLSKIPSDVTQFFFTLCSCGPADLSGFQNPSIMLYQNSQPDANLLEYSINQAEKSVSCVMARMIRQPMRTQGDCAVVARILRRLRMPLLCVDLCMAMAAETTWSIQALGTEEWNLQQKICGNYHLSKNLIEERLKDRSSASARTVGVSLQRRGGETSNATQPAA